jgi:hypothetical protein
VALSNPVNTIMLPSEDHAGYPLPGLIWPKSVANNKEGALELEAFMYAMCPFCPGNVAKAGKVVASSVNEIRITFKELNEEGSF